MEGGPETEGQLACRKRCPVGSGPSISHLYTERDDFTDFHLRLEARFNQGGSSGVYLRCPFGPSLPSAEDPKFPEGYEATINNGRVAGNFTGGLYPGVGNALFVTEADDRTLQTVVHAGGDRRRRCPRRPGGREIKCIPICPGRLRPSGHIALQQFSPETVIEFRKIEIKELEAPRSERSKGDTALPEYHRPGGSRGLSAGRIWNSVGSF